ncbi:BGTF surface domain-containing protein [Halorubrum trapanicum]|uniref:BGTF surface domain-containing protein n=1 Tax=Halorubrum trapanicum TaxID=29284 RepID=UPI00156124D9|nr:BGTF surface domain-containing protein [Halorubrum trapanicum]
MTMDHDHATDTRSTDSTATDSDRTVDSGPDRRFRPDEIGPSAFQTSVIALVVLVALAGVVATAPAAAGLAPGSSAPAVEAGPTAPVAVEAPGSTGPADRPEIDGGFSRSTYTGVAGDPVRIRYTADNPGEDEYLLIGGNRLTDTGQPVGFVDVLKITGSSETTINTRTLGTDASNVESCGLEDTSCDLEFVDENGDPVAENLSALPSATGAGGLARPLVPQRYRLAITNGTFVVEDSGVVTPTASADQADLLLEKPKFREEVEVFTTADRDALGEDVDAESLDVLRENGLDRSVVTKGNRIVLGFESTGIWGALSHFAAERDAGPIEAGGAVDHRVLADLLEKESGVSLRVRQTNPGMNEPPATLDLSRADAEDVSLIFADATELATPDAPGRFYLVIDTSDGDHFTEEPEPGDEFAVEFALEGTEGERYAFADGGEPPGAFNASSAFDGGSEQFPYWTAGDSTVRAEASFTVRERYLRYDHVTDDGDLLVEIEDGRLTGTTSLLPRREMTATFVNDAGDAPFRTESPLEIGDGNFTIAVDLEEVSPGTRLNYELYEGSTLRDSRTVIVVGDADNPDELVIDDAPENVTVTEGGNLSALRVVARNAGGLTGEGELTLTVDNGSAVGSWGVRLEPGKSRTYAFGSVTVDLDPGTYPFTLRLDGDTHGGTLVVEQDPATTTIDDEGDGSTENGTDTGDGGADDGTDVDGSGDDGDSEPNSTAPNGSDSGADSNDTETDGDGGPGATSDGDAPAEQETDSVGMLPLPFGTREAFGGTVLVGAIHLLGHWV